MLLPLSYAVLYWGGGPDLADLLSPPTPEATESRGRLPLQFRGVWGTRFTVDCPPSPGSGTAKHDAE